MRRALWLSLFLLLVPLPTVGASPWPTCKTRPLRSGAGEALGIDPSLAQDLEALLQDAVASGLTHSAAALVARRGKVFHRVSAGGARVDSIFDLASITKVVATAPSVMRLLERRRRLTLRTPASRYLRWTAVPDKQAITVEQLLLHVSGLHSVVWRGELTDGRDVILGRIQRSKLRAAPGQRFRYSDIGYILLGELVAEVGGKSLDQFARERLFGPLGMCDTGFVPPADRLPRVITPWPEGGKEGQVYDPLAARMGGVAGHAGLFSTVDDLARFGQMMLNGGVLHGKRVLTRRSVRQMTRPHPLPGSTEKRGLGWMLNLRPAGSTRSLSTTAYGHGGYTGTSLWIDPRDQLVLVLLVNRTRLTPTPPPGPLRTRFHDLVLGAISRPSARPVRTGLDRLAQGGFKQLRGRRVGLITNRTAVDRRGRWIVDLLADAPKVRLEALFVPEHGLKAKLDRHIKDGVLRQGEREIPIYSLFGGRRRPTDATLKGVDTLVFDVATVGVRYYTYLATMGWAMEEAARRRLRFVVLDRPDPLGGQAVQGPLAIDRTPSSTNYFPLPVRYGMTVGELARMFNAERRIRARLKVVRLAGWQRGQLLSETGLPWVDPSPNIRSVRQALLYAGVGLLEGTNLAVGRGTDAPFQLVGAPWIDGKALAAEVNRQGLKGVRAVPTSFTPSSSKYRKELCHGVRLLVTDMRALDPPALGLALAVALRKLHADSWKTEHLHRLVRHPPTVEAVLAGKPLAEILPLWQAERERFLRLRRRYLLY